MSGQELVRELMDHQETLLMVLITVGIVLCSAFKAVTTLVTGLARERTRREIAAYIAEGTMTPDQGERLINARQRS